jgi:cell shape-determining protein MreC
MSYLLDRKIQRNKFFKITAVVFLLMLLFYFRSGIFKSFAYASQMIFRPVFLLGNNVGSKLDNLGSYFSFKNSLFLQNEELKTKLNENELRMSNYKEVLGRNTENKNFILSAILAKPNRSIYDTLVIDAGSLNEVKIGDLVFALGNIPIGRVSEIFPNSSKVVLFSSPREKTQAIINDSFLEITGRGGGNFEIILPRDFKLEKGTPVLMPGMDSYVLAVAETIISDPRNPFTEALLVSPVNIQELKFVQIEKQK